MYQNLGRAREPCSEVLSSDCFKMPKIVSKCPRAIRLFQNAQNCFKMPNERSRDLTHHVRLLVRMFQNAQNCFKMPNSGSRVTRDCFKMPKIVSKCPKFVIWLLDHHNYTTLVCFACLTYNMDRFVKRIATPIVVCDS